MKKTYYVIELTNSEFASFHQVMNTEIDVFSWKENKIHNADFFNSEESAKSTFDDLMISKSSWVYSGKCLTPKAIRKIELQLF